jgi:hypothetical protein
VHVLGSSLSQVVWHALIRVLFASGYVTEDECLGVGILRRSRRSVGVRFVCFRQAKKRRLNKETKKETTKTKKRARETDDEDISDEVDMKSELESEGQIDDEEQASCKSSSGDEEDDNDANVAKQFKRDQLRAETQMSDRVGKGGGTLDEKQVKRRRLVRKASDTSGTAAVAPSKSSKCNICGKGKQDWCCISNLACA